MPGYTEADYENSVIELFRNDLGYEYVYGPDIEKMFTYDTKTKPQILFED